MNSVENRIIDSQKKYNSIPKISVITVCLNSEVTILKTLSSVGSQNYNNLEHIIIDGVSTDKTLSIINANKRPNVILVSEPDKGLYDAINKGLTLSTGDIVGLLHSDDIFLGHDVLSKISNVFMDKRVSFSYGNLEYVCHKNLEKISRVWKSKQFERGLLYQGWMPPHPTLFLRKEVLNEVGFYDLKYRISADFDYIIRLFSEPTLVGAYIDETITVMRTGGASGNSPRKFFNKSVEDYKILKKHNIGGLCALAKKKIFKISQLR